MSVIDERALRDRAAGEEEELHSLVEAAAAPGSVEPLLEADTGKRKGVDVIVTLIREGFGNDRDKHYYGRQALQEALPLFNTGRVKMYLNHLDAETKRKLGGLPRPIQDLGARLLEAWGAECTDPKVPLLDGRPRFELKGRARISHPLLADIVEADPEAIGVSIDARGKSSDSFQEGRAAKNVDHITRLVSADYVTEAGAHGKINELVEAFVEAELEREGAAMSDATALERETDELNEKKTERHESRHEHHKRLAKHHHDKAAECDKDGRKAEAGEHRRKAKHHEDEADKALREAADAVTECDGTADDLDEAGVCRKCHKRHRGRERHHREADVDDELFADDLDDYGYVEGYMQGYDPVFMGELMYGDPDAYLEAGDEIVDDPVELTEHHVTYEHRETGRRHRQHARNKHHAREIAHALKRRGHHHVQIHEAFVDRDEYGYDEFGEARQRHHRHGGGEHARHDMGAAHHPAARGGLNDLSGAAAAPGDLDHYFYTEDEVHTEPFDGGARAPGLYEDPRWSVEDSHPDSRRRRRGVEHGRMFETAQQLADEQLEEAVAAAMAVVRDEYDARLEQLEEQHARELEQVRQRYEVARYVESYRGEKDHKPLPIGTQRRLKEQLFDELFEAERDENDEIVKDVDTVLRESVLSEIGDAVGEITTFKEARVTGAGESVESRQGPDQRPGTSGKGRTRRRRGAADAQLNKDLGIEPAPAKS